MLPTVMLDTGAAAGGGFTDESRLIVNVTVVLRDPDVGEMLVIPLPPPATETGSKVATDVRITRSNRSELLPELV